MKNTNMNTGAASLLPCPFCGGAAYIEQPGTRRQSCIVECGSCGLRHESGDEGAMCGTSWNRRTTPQADAAPSALPDMSANVSHVTRRIRRCENEPAAQLVLEHFAKEYARAAIAAGGAQEAVRLTADDADMFWPEHDGEQMHHSLDDAVTAVFEDSGANPGDEFEFTCAARLPKVKVRIIDVTENGFEWEIAGPAASNGEQA
jgi:Lar family restriction alleviation protein